MNDLVDHFRKWFARIDDDSIFWFLKGRELAFHQFLRKKMGHAMLQSITDRFRIDVEINKVRWRSLIAQHPTVRFLEGRTGQDDRMAFVYLMLQLIVQSLKPRRSVLVIQRDPVLHLFDVRRRMEIVCIKKDPTQLLSDLHSYGRLPGTGYSHENNCLRGGLWHIL
jgi:hypothetical protein